MFKKRRVEVKNAGLMIGIIVVACIVLVIISRFIIADEEQKRIEELNIPQTSFSLNVEGGSDTIWAGDPETGKKKEAENKKFLQQEFNKIVKIDKEIVSKASNKSEKSDSEVVYSYKKGTFKNNGLFTKVSDKNKKSLKEFAEENKFNIEPKNGDMYYMVNFEQKNKLMLLFYYDIDKNELHYFN